MNLTGALETNTLHPIFLKVWHDCSIHVKAKSRLMFRILLWISNLLLFAISTIVK